MVLNVCGTCTGWWFGTLILFSHILGRIIPTDELIFFRGVAIPPSSFFCNVNPGLMNHGLLVRDYKY